MIQRHLLGLITLCSLASGSCFADVGWIQPQTSGVRASFRGIAVRNANEAWVAGSDGTVIHTVDAGQTWNKVAVTDDELDFRDIALTAPDGVLMMAAGPGDRSRIFRSTDNGRTWTIPLVNADAMGFFNAIEMMDAHRGLLIGDPIDGQLDLYRTVDGGQSWNREVGPSMRKGEYGFAASGTNVVAVDSNVWIATGGSSARVIRSTDAGRTWVANQTPIASGNESSGIFSIAFRDQRHGSIVGGDYKNPEVDDGNIAFTSDGGTTWTLAEPRGKIPHKACVRHIAGKSWITVGRTGVDISQDDGVTWKSVSQESYYTCDIALKSNVGWMAGSDGRVARFEFPSKD